MDYVPSPESFYAPEFAKSTFAASPNSLYMYDQERHDIQNALNNGILGQTCTGSDVAMVNAEPDFDLNPQYENSNSLEGYLGGMLNDTMMPGTSEASLTMQSAICSEKQASNGMLGFMETMRSELKQEGPTLAELNMDPYLFEDIYSIIGEEDKAPVSGAMKQVASDVRKQCTATRPVKTETSPPTYTSVSPFRSQQPQGGSTLSRSQVPSATCSMSNIFGLKPQNVAVVPPISVTSTTIKTEPVDTYDTDGKSCLHKMLSTPPLRPILGTAAPVQTSSPPRQVMPVVGQSRAPSLAQQPIKSESVEEKWKEIEKFIHDPELASGRKRKRYASGSSAIMSDDEDYNHHMDNMTDDEDSDSDIDSDFSDTPLEESLTELAKKSKQYFWQYNVQAKGPKGTRLKLQINDSDPHHPSNFEDPVFDATSTSLVGIRHGGKARKGDGNEVAPNPRKLCQIGQQLYKLNRQINNCQVSNDLPAHIRNKSRKEKNKLASRACRLKKKAQHEANKIKLMGLDSEQSELLEVIHYIWPQLKQRAQQHMKGGGPSPGPRESLTVQLDDLVRTHKTNVAGNTTDYVNEVIRKVEDGDTTGGLPIRPKVKK